MPRLFTGLEIPDDVRAQLQRLAAPLPGAMWVDSRNYHVTLRFAGDIDNGRARELAAELGRVEGRAFTMRVTGLGVFGGRDPHALWAGIEAPPELEALARANERAARQAGLKPETRAFHPHVTLARLRHSRDDALARYLGRHGAFRSPDIFVGRFVLYSSRPTVGGGPYVVEETFGLEGGQYAHGDHGDDDHDHDDGGGPEHGRW